MPPDRSTQQAVVGEMIQAAGLAVSLSSSIHQVQIAGLGVIQKAAFESGREGFGMTCADEAAAGHRTAGGNAGHGVIGRTQFVVNRIGHAHQPPLTCSV